MPRLGPSQEQCCTGTRRHCLEVVAVCSEGPVVEAYRLLGHCHHHPCSPTNPKGLSQALNRFENPSCHCQTWHGCRSRKSSISSFKFHSSHSSVKYEVVVSSVESSRVHFKFEYYLLPSPKSRGLHAMIL